MSDQHAKALRVIAQAIRDGDVLINPVHVADTIDGAADGFESLRAERDALREKLEMLEWYEARHYDAQIGGDSD